MDAIFNLKSVRFGYHTDAPVLDVSKLDIPRGKLVFVTGPSGIGKSTLLEALALMSNTTQKSADARFLLNPVEYPTVDMLNAWSQPKKILSQIRQDNFSFIFQTTNLMPNFTLGENMAFSGLISGKSKSETNEEIARLMDSLKLDRALLDNKASQASGGQRQRIAFVRALSKPFQVLFGDEPTGNLDDDNALLLFDVLKRELTAKNRTGIIVTHHKQLANQFADVKIEIRKKELGNSSGFIGRIDTSSISEQGT